MNQVERLTVECERDGRSTSVHELIKAVELYLKERDLNPVRYQWKAEGGGAIVAKKTADQTALTQAQAQV